MSDTAGNMENGSFFVELLDIFVGVVPVNFLKARKNDAFDLKPHFSANVTKVYFLCLPSLTDCLNCSTR